MKVSRQKSVDGGGVEGEFVVEIQGEEALENSDCLGLLQFGPRNNKEGG